MKDLGVKRKDMYGTDTCCTNCTSDSVDTAAAQEARNNETVYPKIDAAAALAKILPIEDMQPGMVYETTVRLRLNSIDGYGSKDGPTRVCIEILAMDDLECEDDSENAGENEDDETKAVMGVMANSRGRSPSAS